VVSLLDETSLLARTRGLGVSPDRLYEAFKLVHSSQVDILAMVGRSISDGDSIKEISRRLSERRVEEHTERRALLGAFRSMGNNSELTPMHVLFWGLQSYFELLPLTGRGPAAEMMERAIARAIREPESLRARGEIAHAAVLSLRAVQRAARLIANEYAAIQYAGLERRRALG
jgi:hypothetical protein